MQVEQSLTVQQVHRHSVYADVAKKESNKFNLKGNK